VRDTPEGVAPASKVRVGMPSAVSKSGAIACVAISALALSVATTAFALDIELNDVAPDRVERQRHFARGELPLTATPRLDQLDERLKSLDLASGRAIYIRIFKAESELELWMQNSGGTFTRLAVYPICHWTGSLGPKLKEGDKQSPEGFYTVGTPQTRLVGRWRRAFNLGFPNLHDHLLNRTGSYILIHGGCSSVGCFAMTDEVQEEIYGLARAALSKGQDRFQVHVFPFRMTPENLERHAEHEWAHTWNDLKPAYDSFERTRVPPRIALCGMRYKIADGLPGETGSDERRLPVLRSVSAEARAIDPNAVIDANGNWIAPPCDFEDEAKRREFYAGSQIATAGTPVAAPVVFTPSPSTSAVTLNAPTTEAPESAKRSLAARALEREAAASDAESTSGSRVRRIQQSAKPTRRESGSAQRDAAPSVDGFGSATFRANQRMTATGG
jgi:murein L,D-transpeptidase YafK